MKSSWDFLTALGLDESASVRDIRRAYAHKLKQIDPGQDPAGFQALREAYETALSWTAYREREVIEADAEPPPVPVPVQMPTAEAEQVQVPHLAPVAPHAQPSKAPEAVSSTSDPALPAPPSQPAPQSPPQPLSEPQPPAPQQLADLVFERLAQDAARLAASGRLGEPQAWHAALLARLQDAELENIGARILFEQRVVELLGAGWRPGNEALFPAAVAAFEWSAERRGLAQFGYSGHLLNEAIDERALFDLQPPVARGVQERVAALLRRPQPASVAEVLDHMEALEEIEVRFPSLLAVVADTGKIEHWRAVYAEHHVDEEPGPSTRERLARLYWWILLLIGVFVLLRALYNSTEPPPPPPVQPDQPLIEASASPPASIPELVQPYLAPVRYTPATPGKLAVSYTVYLLDDGSVNATDMIDPSSGDPAFDMAVAQAILDARAFPPELPRVFRVKVSAGGAAPLIASALPVVVTPAPDDQP